jgi:pyruvate dehydrogenase E2 component (dihydrolipoamide acetyltransferase)
MPIEVIIPRLGWSMDEGLFGEWLINDGDFVNVGDMLFVLEGEKALQEIESFDEGILHIPADAPQSGDTVAVGQRLAYLLAEGESPPAPDTTAPVAENVENVQPAHKPTQPTEPVTRTANRVVASPRARRTARQLGVEWATIPGSGRNGRIRERDVIAAAQQSPAQAGLPKTRGTLQPPSKMRRTIAQRMLAAVQQTAPVTLTTKVDASQLFAARQRYKSSGAENAPSYNDILVQLVANSLPQFPELNASWINDAVYTYDEINIAIATDTPQGLLAPVLRNATELSLEEIAAESQRLTEQARSGQLTEEQLSGGTFTITNLGMFDIDHFTPIINLPQTAILGIGRIADEPVIAGDKVIPGKTLSLSLTFDHRVTDGAPAARWLQRPSELILQPQR